MPPSSAEGHIAVLHQDDALVVASKPAGIAVHRGPRLAGERDFLLQRLGRQLGRHLYPVHRLDRACSGLIAFALRRDVAAALQRSLAAPDAHKGYLVLCRGETPERFVSERPLSNERGEPQPARTEFVRLATFSRCSLLGARIVTGRRHQIRRHLQHLAHQVIGDTSYGKGRINRWFRQAYGLPRLFLHAAELEIGHPVERRRLRVRDRLPDDLRGFLRRLPDVPRDVLEGV